MNFTVRHNKSLSYVMTAPPPLSIIIDFTVPFHGSDKNSAAVMVFFFVAGRTSANSSVHKFFIVNCCPLPYETTTALLLSNLNWYPFRAVAPTSVIMRRFSIRFI